MHDKYRDHATIQAAVLLYGGGLEKGLITVQHAGCGL